jgi:hypothetical protein
MNPKRHFKGTFEKQTQKCGRLKVTCADEQFRTKM